MSNPILGTRSDVGLATWSASVSEQSLPTGKKKPPSPFHTFGAWSQYCNLIFVHCSHESFFFPSTRLLPPCICAYASRIPQHGQQDVSTWLHCKSCSSAIFAKQTWMIHVENWATFTWWTRSISTRWIFCLRSRASCHQTWLIKRPAQSSPNPQKVVITMPRPPFFTANSNFNTHNSCSFCLYFSHVLRAPTPGPTVHFLSPARSRWM